MILLIDNYDSFTYNLSHYLGELGCAVKVVRNDDWTVAQVLEYQADAVVLSPGPCTPNEAGICMDLLMQSNGQVPILGVCLGHQALGQVFGGKVIRAPYVMHGKTSMILHEGKSVFKQLPSTFEATRYHSLIVERESLPDCLEITAETDDGLIMGLQHKTLPFHGVQFHPESIATHHGHQLLSNFLDIAQIKHESPKVPA
ncbi:MAG: aminodeoxychorismate/anthranilate synthase component II [Sphingomonadales bacterium]|jgi:anthranilate synthase component 2